MLTLSVGEARSFGSRSTLTLVLAHSARQRSEICEDGRLCGIMSFIGSTTPSTPYRVDLVFLAIFNVYLNIVIKRNTGEA